MKIFNKKLREKVIDAISAFNLTKQSEFEFKIQKILDDSYLKDSFDLIKSAVRAKEYSIELNYDENLEEVLNTLGYKTEKIGSIRDSEKMLVSWKIEKEIQYEKK